MKEVVIMREYIMKGIKTTINSSDYISNINDVVGIIKDVTFEVEIIDIIKGGEIMRRKLKMAFLYS